MIKRLGVLLAITAVVAAGCSSSKKSTTTTATTEKSGGPATYDVGVDAKSTGFNGSFTTYFPKELTVHPGDTVDFKETFSGEPHTVTFGSQVDTGLAAADKLPPTADEPPDLLKIPNMFPQGPGDAIQSAAQPCFLDAGAAIPATDACPKAAAQPDFTGKQVLYSSGWLADQQTFTMKLAADLAPGTYRWFCEIHRGVMQGKLTVVAADAKAQTPAEVAAAGKAQLTDYEGKLAPVATKLGTLTAQTAQAGGDAQALQDAIVAQFGPKDIKVPVGGTVTWDVRGPHTITFGGNEAMRTYISRTPDGAVHFNPESFKPAGGGEPFPGGGGPPTKPTVFNGGSWDGTGVHSTGLGLGFGPPGILMYKLTFTKAGTYKYQCDVHPDMEGTVTVG